MAKENKQFTVLSDEELEKVTGGASIDCSLPENKDNVKCSDKLKGLDVALLQNESLNYIYNMTCLTQ